MDAESYTVSRKILNYKSKNFNLFTTQGYNDRNNPGNAFTDSRYLNSDNTTRNYVNETRENERNSKGYNGNFGMETIKKRPDYLRAFFYYIFFVIIKFITKYKNSCNALQIYVWHYSLQYYKIY
mgnify:CR=1 FL=1